MASRRKCDKCDWWLEETKLCMMEQKPRTCAYFKDSKQSYLKRKPCLDAPA